MFYRIFKSDELNRSLQRKGKVGQYAKLFYNDLVQFLRMVDKVDAPEREEVAC